ncbi:MAG TPA: class I SAM-dependent methyltransferase [Haliangiales bacterium]|nr:class I SAM-dependent methyltransferase [Haliangiales bacterium]
MSSVPDRKFLPAAGLDLFLPLYDPLTRLMGFDRPRRALLEQAALAPGFRVLDVGCGTGTLAILATKLHPAVEIVGLDPDPKALARARRKAERAGVSLQLDQGFAGSLAYRDASFDRVLSSMMFHHLEVEEKDGMLREIARVLKPGGRLELLDFAGRSPDERSGLARLIHSNERLRDSVAERVLERMAAAGLKNARLVRHERVLFTRLAYYQAASG